MFILTSIAINSSLTSKPAHVCFGSNSGISSNLFLKFFALIGFLNVREKEKELKSLFHCLCAMSIYPSTNNILQIPTVKMCENES